MISQVLAWQRLAQELIVDRLNSRPKIRDTKARAWGVGVRKVTHWILPDGREVPMTSADAREIKHLLTLWVVIPPSDGRRKGAVRRPP
jgi:hypothetical protein